MAASLAINKVQRELKLPNSELLPEDQQLPRGHLRLFNHWRPNLAAGRYSIAAVQTVTTSKKFDGKVQAAEVIQNEAGPGQTEKPGRQLFDVIAPQFSLNPALINSYYPPDGHADEGRILPHIVFSDAHVPWFREAGRKEWMTKNIDHGRNFVPWMALMVFTADELRLSVDDAKALKLDTIKVGKVSPPPESVSTTAVDKLVFDPANLPSSGAYGMTVQDYLGTITSRTDYETTIGKESTEWKSLLTSSEKTSIIFPTREQIHKVFDPTNDHTFRGIQAQKLHSHVRQLNTEGMPDAGVSGHGFYSVVVSSMTGDIATASPTTHIVHLVSIEHLDDTLNEPWVAPLEGDKSPPQRIGIVSLFSWTYHCTPEAINFEEVMQNLGAQAQPLRPPEPRLTYLKANADSQPEPSKTMAIQLHDRLKNGYTMARWRAPAGEESIAFNRGPLVPVTVLDVPTTKSTQDEASWPPLSMTGRDYLIFDKANGVLDATYSAAWSLGRLIAISDPVFNSALLRFRSAIWTASTSKLRKKMNGIQDWSDVLAHAANNLAASGSLASGDFAGAVNRLNPSPNTPLAPGVDNPTVSAHLAANVRDQVQSAARSKDQTLFNGFLLASASNSDWEIIYKWIYDAFFLGHLPAHVLFPEPSSLKSMITTPTVPGQTKMQPEALRFFNIDHAWIDAFLDGALSCANHVEPRYDTIRLKIKEIVNDVLAQKIGGLSTRPPIPRSGFVLRSMAVRATPDMKVKVRRYTSAPDPKDSTKFKWSVDEDHDALLRHTLLDANTMLTLVDCPLDEVAYIEYAQPAHQQRFAFGNTVRKDDAGNVVVTPDVDVIKLFTNPDRAPPNAEKAGDPKGSDLEWHSFPNRITQATCYDQKTRCIDSMRICDAMGDMISEWSKANDCYKEQAPNESDVPAFVSCSSAFGIEMNDRAYHFRFQGNAENTSRATSENWIRRLWTGPPDNTKPPDFPTPPAPSRPVIPIPSTVNVPTSFPVTAPLSQAGVPMRQDLPPTVPPKQPQFKQTPVYDTFNSPSYCMVVHPDFRSPPPRPYVDPKGTFYIPSIIDALPTRTDYLYDLIFSIRRTDSDARSPRVLKYLQIEIPVSTGDAARDKETEPKGHRPREPLLAAGEAAHGGAKVVANQRFVVSMFRGPASAIGDWRWDGREILLITLTPRSGRADGTLALNDVKRSSAVAVRLAECVLADVLMPEVRMNVYAHEPNDPKKTTTIKIDGRSRSPIKLTEVYDDGGKTKTCWSWCLAVKSPEGDADFDKLARGGG